MSIRDVQRRVMAIGTTLTFVATLTGSLAAQQNPAKNPPTQTNPTVTGTTTKGADSETFVRTAAQADMAEVALGRLAQSKAQAPAVRDFAQRMIDDHSKNEQQLRDVAKNKSVTWPDQVSAHQHQTESTLSGLQGAAFDRAFMNAMVADHTSAVSEFQQATKSADPDVKAYASKTLPVLEEHLKMAKQVQKEVSSGAGGK